MLMFDTWSLLSTPPVLAGPATDSAPYIHSILKDRKAAQCDVFTHACLGIYYVCDLLYHLDDDIGLTVCDYDYDLHTDSCRDASDLCLDAYYDCTVTKAL